MASSLVEVARRENLLIAPDVPWFVGVSFLASLVSAALSYASWHDPAPQLRRVAFGPAFLTAALLGIALSAVGDVGMGLPRAHPTLPGDGETAPAIFHFATIISTYTTAGIIEETAIRGIVQLGLLKVMRPVSAELLADVEFIVLHWIRFSSPGELLLVTLVAVVGGRLTAVTRVTRYAVINHCTCNLGIAVTVLSLRP